MIEAPSTVSVGHLGPFWTVAVTTTFTAMLTVTGAHREMVMGGNDGRHGHNCNADDERDFEAHHC